MNNWTEICSKFKDTELFKEFENEYYNQWGIADLSERTIRDVFGHIICFAETKGYYLGIKFDDSWALPYGNNDKVIVSNIIRFEDKKDIKIAINIFEKPEQAMLWAVATFFEITKGE